MMQLKRIGHVLLRVADLERSRRFYCAVLGFEVMEEDPEHGGLFMALDGHAHTLDLFPAPDASTVAPRTGLGLGVHHVAFQVDTEAALREAHRSLKEHGVTITRAVDHVSQQSIYFHDPDGNLLEIYYELPNARALFLQGRGDRDQPLVFDD
jgi:catechol 2,3-dioxygenase-like lactoylglutathione lyase family enzyme